MGPRNIAVSLAFFVSACTFNTGANGALTGVDAGSGMDADPVCSPVCLDDSQLLPCGDSAAAIDCPLGCDADANACQSMVPSNNAGTELLDGVTADLVLAAHAHAELNADTGELIIDNVSVRPRGPGVVGGLGFYVLPTGPALLATNTLTVGVDATFRITGSRSVILLSRGDVVIIGLIDASAGCDDEPACPGPGGGHGARFDNDPEASGCSAGRNGFGGLVSQDTGGGGGALGGPGGTGGQTQQAPGGAGGAYPGNCPGASIEPLLGGSGGGAGGLGAASEDGSHGGGGGGALQISSLTAVAVIKTADGDIPGIRASGAGGGGGGLSDGGGGGGAGGSILLEAPVISLQGGIIAANGGGGGGGGVDVLDEDLRGQDGRFGAESARGGGRGNGRGGRGGSLLGAAGDAVGGGADDTGGGGGSYGLIRLNTADADITVEDTVFSPSPSIDFIGRSRSER